jgi:flavin-binding protein dodecin
MTDKVYKLIEVVGTSPESFAQAAAAAVEKTAATVHGLGWFEVTDLRGRITNGKIDQYQVTVKIGFRVD